MAALNEQIHAGSEKRRKLQDALATAQNPDFKAKFSSKVFQSDAGKRNLVLTLLYFY